jgi:hypothetical protein
MPVCGTRGDCGESALGAAGRPRGVFAEEAVEGRDDARGDDEAGADGAPLRAGAAAASASGDVSRGVCAGGWDSVAGRAEGRSGGRGAGKRVWCVCRTGRCRGPCRGGRWCGATCWSFPASRARRVGAPFAVCSGVRCAAQAANWSASPLHVGRTAAAGVPDRGFGVSSLRGTEAVAGGDPGSGVDPEGAGVAGFVGRGSGAGGCAVPAAAGGAGVRGVAGLGELPTRTCGWSGRGAVWGEGGKPGGMACWREVRQGR